MIALSFACVAALLACPASSPSVPVPDTIRLEVGSPMVNGRIYRPHAARVRVYVGEPGSAPVAEWTNELTLGDSAGRQVARWITRGTQMPPNAPQVQWELYQTYDAVTLAPYGYYSKSSTGAWTRLTLDGTRVRGQRRTANDTTIHAVSVDLDRVGYVASASDLVPLAAGLSKGKVMTAPMWSPAMTRTELRVFTVIDEEPVDVEGTRIVAWKVEERRHADGVLLATWWLLDRSPYMVYGEVIQPNGQIRRMTEVEIPLPVR